MRERDRLLGDYLSIRDDIHQSLMSRPEEFIRDNGNGGWCPIERAGQLLAAAMANLYSVRRLTLDFIRAGIYQWNELGLFEYVDLVAAKVLYEQVISQLLPVLTPHEVAVLTEAMGINLSNYSPDKRSVTVSEADLADPHRLFDLIKDLVAPHLKKGSRYDQKNWERERRRLVSVPGMMQTGKEPIIGNRSVVKNLFTYRPRAGPRR
ncbi:hypothetical protein M1523_04625 [Patescibacteria group bacterium]|nr:hypothetical protein [Patescibacteria group bacterium]